MHSSPKAARAERWELGTEQTAQLKCALLSSSGCCFVVVFVRLNMGKAKANTGAHWRLIRERSPPVIGSGIILHRAQF